MDKAAELTFLKLVTTCLSQLRHLRPLKCQLTNFWQESVVESVVNLVISNYFSLHCLFLSSMGFFFLIWAVFCFVFLLRGPGDRELWAAVHLHAWDQSLRRESCASWKWDEKRKGKRRAEGCSSVLSGPSKEQSPEHLHPPWTDVDIMTAPSVIDQPITPRHKHAHTHWFYAVIGQCGLQSKVVELWVLAHRCLLSLWSVQFCSSAYIHFKFSEALNPKPFKIHNAQTGFGFKIKVLNELDQGFCFQFIVIRSVDVVAQFVLQLGCFHFLKNIALSICCCTGSV